MRKIYILRHCETENFPQKRCIGISDVNLSENGLKHAQCLKRYFIEKDISKILCSDISRAVKTAEIISDGKIEVTELADLREINMGDWDGMYFDAIKSAYPDEYRQRGLDFAAFTPKNGESFTDCQKRALSIFRTILNNTGDIIIVAHAGFNRALLCGLCNIDLQELFTVPQPFGCVNVLSVQNGDCHVQKIGLEVGIKVDEDE